MMTWKRADLLGVLQRLRFVALTAVIVTLVVMWLQGTKAILPAMALGVAAWLIIGSAVQIAERIGLFKISLINSLKRASGMPRAAWGMAIAHSALGIFVIGVTASSAWKIEMIQLMKPGEIILVDDYKITFLGTSNIKAKL